LAQSVTQGFEVSLLARPELCKSCGSLSIAEPEIFPTLSGGKVLPDDCVVLKVTPDPFDVDAYRPGSRHRQQSDRLGMGKIEVKRLRACGGPERRLAPGSHRKLQRRRTGLHISAQHFAQERARQDESLPINGAVEARRALPLID
jgi:hypothetical protein